MGLMGRCTAMNLLLEALRPLTSDIHLMMHAIYLPFEGSGIKCPFNHQDLDQLLVTDPDQFIFSSFSFHVPETKRPRPIDSIRVFSSVWNTNEVNLSNEERKHLTTNEMILTSPTNDDRLLSNHEKLQRIQMEKGAIWWTKYYASKAKLVCSSLPIANDRSPL